MNFLSQIITKLKNIGGSEDTDIVNIFKQKYPGLHTFKTLDMADIIKKIKEDENVNVNIDKDLFEDFLEQNPTTSNYLIINQKNGEKCVTQIYDRYVPSITYINDHIKVKNLTNKCVIGLSERQKKKLDELLAQYEVNKEIDFQHV
jgi:hypothetical protein